MEEVLVFGTGGQARVVIEEIECTGKYRVAGLVDDNREVGYELFGYKVLGGIADLPKIGVGQGIIGIGDNWSRWQVAAKVAAIRPDFRYITLISPLSKINKRKIEIGEGTYISNFVIVDCCIEIGKHCIIDAHTIVGHDSRVGDFVNIHPKVAVCGDVRIGECTTIAVGADIVQGVTVGEHTVIGAGAAVVKDIPAYSVAVGIPCRVVRERRVGEPYL